MPKPICAVRQVSSFLGRHVKAQLYTSTSYITAMAASAADDNAHFRTIDRVKYLLFYLCIGQYLLRILLASFLLNTNFLQRFNVSSSSYYKIDPVIGYAINLGVIDQHSVIVIWPLYLVVFCIHFTVQWRRGLHCARLVYELIVINGQNSQGFNWGKVIWSWINSKKHTANKGD